MNKLHGWAAIAALLLMTACSSDTDKVEDPPAAVSVLVQRPSVQDVPVYIESIGSLQPSILAEVRPQVSGVVSEVFVVEGEWVKEGSPLFKIDPAPYVIKEQEAQAKLSMDQASLIAAERKSQRFQSLADKELISKNEWEELEAAVDKASASVEVDKACLKSCQLDLNHCVLNSCIEGRVGRLDIHPGSLVTGSQTTSLASIAKMNPLIVEFLLTEKEIIRLSTEEAQIEILSLYQPEEIHQGHVTFIDNQYDRKSGLILVRGKVDNAKFLLRPGQAVKVRIPISMLSHAKIIPQKAVKYNNDGSYLYVVGDDSRVESRKIQLGMTLQENVIVLEGLDDEKEVITDGHLRLYPGSKVDVKR